MTGLGVDGGTPETEIVVTLVAMAVGLIEGWWQRRRKPPV